MACPTKSLCLAFFLRALRAKCSKGAGLDSLTPFCVRELPVTFDLTGKVTGVPRPLLHSHLFLPSHVTYVHWALGQLSHHENCSNTLPLGMGHNGKVGRPGFKMLGAGRIGERK